MPSLGVLEHDVAGIIDKIGIVAGTPEHGVGAAGAVEQVVPGIAVKRVRLVVAVTLEIAAALQHQGLDVRGQPVVAESQNTASLPSFGSSRSRTSLGSSTK